MATKAPFLPPAGKALIPSGTGRTTCAWELPAQGGSHAETLELEQGHSGKCSPRGVTRACWDFPWHYFKEKRAKGVTLPLIPGWAFDIPGRWLNLYICCLKRHQPGTTIPASDHTCSSFSWTSYFGRETWELPREERPQQKCPSFLSSGYCPRHWEREVPVRGQGVLPVQLCESLQHIPTLSHIIYAHSPL